MKSAAMTPLSMTDLSELNIGRSLRMRKRTRATKERSSKKPKEKVNSPLPPSSSESPRPNMPNDPNAIPSPSSPATPARFTKVTDWETMQRFQYELHTEHEALLEQRDARHYELIQDLSMQIAFLREEDPARDFK
nr:hypothetical protein Itr_chr12CG17930 [Ipomoea trifida]